jgi:ribosomal protein S18 acetylase RimI-like enzyme
MTALSLMRPEVYAAFLESSIVDYAEDNVAAGRWLAEGAVERSRAEFSELLPRGLDTPDNFLYEIRAVDGGETVGFIWFAVEERHGRRTAFVYDVVVKEEYRRRGHARRAFQALEPLVVKLGLFTIGLHVFSHNVGAQALYRELGYAATGINMLKEL